MATARPVTPEIASDMPGLPGVPASIGPLRCPTCEQRAATLNHVPDPEAGADLITPTLVCLGCGSVFELEATAYGVGLAAGVLAERGRTVAATAPASSGPARRVLSSSTSPPGPTVTVSPPVTQSFMPAGGRSWRRSPGASLVTSRWSSPAAGSLSWATTTWSRSSGTRQAADPMADLQMREIGTVEDIFGEPLAVSVIWDAEAGPDAEDADGFPGINLEGEGHTFDQAGTEELAKLIVAASWEAARIAAGPKAAEAGNG